MLMYLIVSDPNLVVSAAVQVLKNGKVVAHLYYDSKPRSYEDCVRYGSLRDYCSLSSLVDYFLNAYEKVTFCAHC